MVTVFPDALDGFPTNLAADLVTGNSNATAMRDIHPALHNNAGTRLNESLARLNEVAAAVNQLENLLIGRPWFNVRAYGATGDGVADDTVSVRAAVDACAAAGGGVVFFPPGTYLLNQSEVPVDSVTTAIGRSLDGITIQGVRGRSVLRRTVQGSIFFCGGHTLTGPFSSWASREFLDATVYAINGTLAKGALTVPLATVGDAANFAAGDSVFIRTGQTLDGSVRQPDAELNRLLAVDLGTGVLTLERPTGKGYAQEYFITGTTGKTSTAVTANSAVYGIAKITDRTAGRVTFRDLVLETTATDRNALETNQIDDLLVDGVIATGALGFQGGNNVRDGRIRARSHLTGAGATYHCGFGTGSVDCTIEGGDYSAAGVGFLHLQEGTARCAVRRNRVFSKPSAAAVSGGVSVSARAYDVEIEGNVFSGGGEHAQIGIISVSSDVLGGGRIRGNTIAKGAGGTTTNGINLNDAPDWDVGPNTLLDGLGVRATAASVRQLFSEISIPVNALHVVQGTPALAGTGSAANVPAMLFDGAATEEVAFSVTVPREWVQAQVEIDWVNHGAGAGNVLWFVRGAATAAGGTLPGAEGGSSQGVVAAGTQYQVVRTLLPVLLSVPAGAVVRYRFGRLGADGTDTLGNDAALVGVRLKRMR